jgi:hypothetical protein
MKTFQELLGKFLRKKGIFTEAKASFVIEKTKQILEENLGETRKTIEKNISVQKFTEKKIFLHAKNPTWRHTLNAHKKTFLLLLQEEFSSEEIYGIIVS